jgi:hypothetical protein
VAAAAAVWATRSAVWCGRFGMGTIRASNSTFDPQIVKKPQRRLTGVDEIVSSLTAKGLTTGEIARARTDTNRRDKDGRRPQGSSAGRWREVRPDLGVPDATSHSFRKTVATSSMTKGCPNGSALTISVTAESP